MQVFGHFFVDGATSIATLSPRTVERLDRIKVNLRFGSPVAPIHLVSSTSSPRIEEPYEDRLSGLMVFGRRGHDQTHGRAIVFDPDEGADDDVVLGSAMLPAAYIAWTLKVSDRPLEYDDAERRCGIGPDFSCDPGAVG